RSCASSEYHGRGAVDCAREMGEKTLEAHENGRVGEDRGRLAQGRASSQIEVDGQGWIGGGAELDGICVRCESACDLGESFGTPFLRGVGNSGTKPRAVQSDLAWKAAAGGTLLGREMQVGPQRHCSLQPRKHAHLG